MGSDQVSDHLTMARIGLDTHFFAVRDSLFSEKLVRFRVPMDGNCLFYSLLVACGRSMEQHADLRRACASYVSSHWHSLYPGSSRNSFAVVVNDQYSRFSRLREEGSLRFSTAQDYCEYITAPNSWGSTIEAHVASILLGLPLIVRNADGTYSPGLLNYVPDRLPLHIVYSNGNHFDALLPQCDDMSMLAAVGMLRAKMVASTAVALEEAIDVDALQADGDHARGATLDLRNQTTPLDTTALPDLASRRLLQNGPGRKDCGVRKVRDKWKMGIRLWNGGYRPRITYPVEFTTSDIATCA